MLILYCLRAHSLRMICGCTLLTRVSKSVVAHPGCQMASSWSWVWSDKICRRSGREKKKSLAKKIKWELQIREEEQKERENLINGVRSLWLQPFKWCHVFSGFTRRRILPELLCSLLSPSLFPPPCLLMTFNSLTSLCRSPLSNAVEHSKMGFIYLWSCIVCMRGLK